MVGKLMFEVNTEIRLVTKTKNHFEVAKNTLMIIKEVTREH